MELLQLKYFKTVAEIGKISEAAQTLFISAPALSTSISRLETELGVKLFDRTSNRITLNRQGKILLRYTDQIFSQLDSAKTEIAQSLQQQKQHVSILTVSSVQWVDMITTFTQEYPGFTLQCTSIRQQDLSIGGLSPQHSFLLCAQESIPETYLDRLEGEFLFEEQPMLMVPANHPFAQLESVHLSQLADERVYLPMQDYPLHTHLRNLYAEEGIPYPEDNAYSHLMLQHMVASGMGLAFSSARSAQYPNMVLRYIPIANSTSWECKIFWRKDHSFTEDELLFKDFLLQYYHRT